MDIAHGDVRAVLDTTSRVLDSPPMKFRGHVVLFLDDFTRSEANGLVHNTVNRRWLRELLERVLIDSGCLLRDWEGESLPKEIRAFMALLGLPASPDGWAATSIIDPLPPAAARWLEERIQGADIVIGFELPVFLLRFLTQCGIAFLDVAIDAVRFARDLFLSVRTNCPALEQILRLYEIDETILKVDAALLRGGVIRQAGLTIGDPESRVAVFFGQTCVDRALVSHGKLMRPADFSSRIADATRNYDVLLIRPHPAEPDETLLRELQRKIPIARRIMANSYALLTYKNVHHVFSLSSSLITEVEYFNKAASKLLMPDTENPKLISDICSRRYRLDANLLSSGFWNGGKPTHSAVPDLLRNSLGMAWGRVWPLSLEAPKPSLPATLARLRKHAGATRRKLLGH